MYQRTCRLFILCIGALLIAATASASPPPSSDANAALLQKAVDGSWRSAANKARDTYRHPAETLQFFGIKPGMTVIELEPGGGWYTEILAPFLHDHGHLIEAAPASAKFAAKLKAAPALYGNIGKPVPFSPPSQVRLGADNSADMVLTFRNTHDWLINDKDTLAAVFKAAFDVLKHGGVFGVVEHRARPFEDPTLSAGRLHRIPEDYLISLALKSGFRLDGVSEINANPKDPEDVNVHRLPPDLAGPDGEHAQMKAIGESDRMTLRLVKP
ncbi:class I SAM-dependent methyltransferase [Rhodanobacter sp. Col0626]|uniref:class I SAM-dependent methyltransferase n=1 Tax=Rhodanobacter sp. Col0626 TaxID=3415679 RepID=UPI003CF28130